MATSRSIQPSSNPYAGGAVIFDSGPYTQFALNQQAREEANKNAFLKSFQDLGNNINAAGLHQSDVPDVLANKTKWQQFVMSHQKEYNNPSLDNGRVYGEASRLFNEALAHVGQAKQKVLNLSEHAKIIQDPEKAALLSESDHPNYQRALLPVSTAGQQNGYQPWVADYNPKPFDVLSYQKKLPVKEVTGATVFENMPDYKTSFLRTPKIKIEQKFDKDQIAEIAESEYSQNRSYKKYINDIVKDPSQYQIYNDIYKKAFGKNLDIQHPEQIAIAHTLALLPKDYEKTGDPEIDRMAYFLATNKITSGQADRRAALNRQYQMQKESMGADAADEFIQNARTGRTYSGKEGEIIEVLNIKPIIASEYKKGEKIPSFGRGNDGKVYAIYGFQKADDGSKTDIPDWTKVEEVPSMQFKSTIINKALPSGYKAKQVTGGAQSKPKSSSGINWK